MQLKRLELLVGNKIDLIKNKTILIIGIGGVGGYALEALVRSGVNNIIIVDNDIVDITNLNRQIISLHSNIGQLKVEVAKKRVLDINPECNIKIVKEYLNKDNTKELFNEKIDYIVDACDTMEVKKELIRIASTKHIKLISSMGTGNKMDPSKLEIIELRKTSYDPIAKILRKMVKDERISTKVMVICSKEEPIKTNSNVIGSNSFVPATAGLLCASYIINDIVGEK
ncbi:MAG TPA: tRNA threonylcarbamoyladenosine dehydratase [Bacilli bacterium]|nr:tRNA threonylcarbamoyladenosine dehydratase [Bacilli bacterium]